MAKVLELQEYLFTCYNNHWHCLHAGMPNDMDLNEHLSGNAKQYAIKTFLINKPIKMQEHDPNI